jgi:hypothetical protein
MVCPRPAALNSGAISPVVLQRHRTLPSRAAGSCYGPCRTLNGREREPETCHSGEIGSEDRPRAIGWNRFVICLDIGRQSDPRLLAFCPHVHGGNDRRAVI